MQLSWFYSAVAIRSNHDVIKVVKQLTAQELVQFGKELVLINLV